MSQIHEGFTSHGHMIPGALIDNSQPWPKDLARCGGPAICFVCSREAVLYHETHQEREKPMNPLQLKNYTRRPFSVDAVQVTNENLEDVAKWCGGSVVNTTNEGKAVRLANSKSRRGPKLPLAKIGDWVLTGPDGFRAFSDGAFNKVFELTV